MGACDARQSTAGSLRSSLKLDERGHDRGGTSAGWGGRIRTSAFRILSELCSLNFHMIGADLMAPHYSPQPFYGTVWFDDDHLECRVSNPAAPGTQLVANSWVRR
jgi:hypothetical protein